MSKGRKRSRAIRQTRELIAFGTSLGAGTLVTCSIPRAVGVPAGLQPAAGLGLASVGGIALGAKFPIDALKLLEPRKSKKKRKYDMW